MSFLLFSIAYRTFETIADAEELVQERFLRWQAVQLDEIESPAAFLVTIISRLCINHSHSDRLKSEESSQDLVWLAVNACRPRLNQADNIREVSPSWGIACCRIGSAARRTTSAHAGAEGFSLRDTCACDSFYRIVRRVLFTRGYKLSEFFAGLTMRLLVMGWFLLILVHIASGQADTAQAPKPGPEVRRLSYYVGTWIGKGETKDGPFGAAGKLSSRMSCEWFAGGFHLVCRGEERGPTGKRAFLNIKTYDEKTKAYSEYGISNFGESEYQTSGSMVGNKRTFIFDTDVEGKPVKFRYIEVMVSPTLFTYQAEASINDGPWKVIAEGKYTKVR